EAARVRHRPEEHHALSLTLPLLGREKKADRPAPDAHHPSWPVTLNQSGHLQ
ncbi:MAG: hypothetical protein RIS64_1259, partial [Bacteroidota bacterium]